MAYNETPTLKGHTMDQNKESLTTLDYVRIAVFVGYAAFGTYQLGKLGYDWVTEGVHVVKTKKNAKKN